MLNFFTLDNEVRISTQQLTHLVIKENFSDIRFSEELFNYYSKWNRRKGKIDLLPISLVAEHSLENSIVISLVAAWQMLLIAARIFDDAEDGDTPHNPSSINIGTGFLLLAQQVLFRLNEFGISASQIQRLVTGYNQAVLTACSGQHADLLGQAQKIRINPDLWLEIALRKSGALFAWACWAGPFLSGKDEKTLMNFQDFGHSLGTLIQVTDDFNDTWKTKEDTWLKSERTSLAYAYGTYVAVPETRSRLEELMNCTSSGEMRERQEIQELLIELGAQKFMLAAALIQKQKALDALKKTGLAIPARQNLSDFIDEIFPIFSLPVT